MTSSGFHGSLPLKNACQVYVIRMRLSAPTSPLGEYSSISVSRQLQENEVYCDTDSIIFILLRDEPELVETGDNLADMTSELNPGEYISEFVSGSQRIMCTG